MDREILFAIKRMNEQINNRMAKLDMLRLSVTGSAIRYEKDPVQTSGHEDRLEEMIARIIDMENEINALVEDFVVAKQKAIRQIDRLEKERWREVLYERYVLCLKIAEIAESQGKSEIWVKKTHKEGLMAFDKLK